MTKQRDNRGNWVLAQEIVDRANRRPLADRLSSPQEGDLVYSTDVGRKSKHWCRWTICSHCGRGRWVQWSLGKNDYVLRALCKRCGQLKYDVSKASYATSGSDHPICSRCGRTSTRIERGQEQHGLIRGLCYKCYNNQRFQDVRDRNRRLYGYTTGSPEQRARYNAKVAGRSKLAHRKLKLQVVKEYGGKCVCCGESIPEMLTIDHINGDGATERRKFRGKNENWDFYAYLRRNGFPKDNYRLLCYNCNLGAYKNGGVCPHQTGGRVVVDD